MRLDAWLMAKAAIILVAVADIGASWWHSDLLAGQRPGQPVGIFLRPFEAHGATVFISQADHQARIGLVLAGVAVVLAWWLVGHFEKRAKAPGSSS